LKSEIRLAYAGLELRAGLCFVPRYFPVFLALRTECSYRKPVPVQPVDATPSDRNQFFLEVVLMRQGRRYGLSAEQRTDIWRRWKAGESLHEIGRAFGKDHGSIQFLLSQHGGIVPAVRRRSPRMSALAI
jgi:hypothetical protein